MDWLSPNWVWMLIAMAFVALHLFGPGGHGGGRRHGAAIQRQGAKDSRRRDEQRGENASIGHRH